MLKEEANSGLEHQLEEKRHSCPKLLISIRDVAEANAALQGGADWIDLKEPEFGSLGPVDFESACQIAMAIEGRTPLSAALGELMDWPQSNSRRLLEIEAISLVKIGLSGVCQLANWFQRWETFSQQVADAGKQLVAVAYADWKSINAPCPQQIIEKAEDCGTPYFLLDTYDKSHGSLLNFVRKKELEEILASASSANLKTVIAGSLSSNSMRSLPQKNIDMLAVRGAVCDRGRTGHVTAQKVKAFRESMLQCWMKST